MDKRRRSMLGWKAFGLFDTTQPVRRAIDVCSAIQRVAKRSAVRQRERTGAAVVSSGDGRSARRGRGGRDDGEPVRRLGDGAGTDAAPDPAGTVFDLPRHLRRQLLQRRFASVGLRQSGDEGVLHRGSDSPDLDPLSTGRHQLLAGRAGQSGHVRAVHRPRIADAVHRVGRRRSCKHPAAEAGRLRRHRASRRGDGPDVQTRRIGPGARFPEARPGRRSGRGRLDAHARRGRCGRIQRLGRRLLHDVRVRKAPQQRGARAAAGPGADPGGRGLSADDPPRMFRRCNRPAAPCLAFKILAAGRLSDRRQWVEHAFRQTFAAIKPNDGVIVGIYDRYSDQPAECADYARQFGHLSRSATT
jgi:hypothetical protein